MLDNTTIQESTHWPAEAKSLHRSGGFCAGIGAAAAAAGWEDPRSKSRSRDSGVNTITHKKVLDCKALREHKTHLQGLRFILKKEGAKCLEHNYT